MPSVKSSVRPAAGTCLSMEASSILVTLLLSIVSARAIPTVHDLVDTAASDRYLAETGRGLESTLASGNGVSPLNHLVRRQVESIGEPVIERGSELDPVKRTFRRPKRLSDQRRAELETLMALSKMTGKLVTVSRGERQLDTVRTSVRQRRSLLDNLKNISYLFQLSGKLTQRGNGAYPVTG